MEKLTKRVVLSSAVATMVMAFSLLGFTNVLKQPKAQPLYSEWMKHLDDDISLRNINMPGSHDTMALYSIGDLAGQCQSLSLLDQLNLGVRFLDIRLKQDGENLKAVHSFVDQKASFTNVLNTVESFIESHPSEFIIMSVKEEVILKNKISFDECVKNYLSKPIYYLENDLPNKLGDVRGKVVLLSRYKGSSVGIPAFTGWKDSKTFTLPNDIYVQDTYRITCKEEKQSEIINCFNETGHALKINFLSAYHTNYFPPSYAPSNALNINPWINKEIEKYDDRGIVLYDFICKENMLAFFGGNH